MSCRRSSPSSSPDAQVRKSAISLAAILDINKDEQVLKDACLGLCQLFGEGIQNDRIQAILEANVVPKLVALLRPSKSRSVPISVQSAALQVLGNVACGDDRQTQVVIDSNALPCLRALLSSADRGIRKEVCWIVSNITESSHQVQDVLDADILPPLLKLLDNQDAACREDATWVLFNLSSNRDPSQIAYLAEKNGVRALCNLLTCSKELDVLWKGCSTVAAVALKGLRNILISGQIASASDPSGYNKMASLVAEAHGVERIEALTTHVSLDVRTRARLLLERMFGAEPTTADLSPPLPPPALTGLSSLSSPPPPLPLGHSGCSCAYQQHHHHGHVGHYHPSSYDALGSTSLHAGLSASAHINHSIAVEHGLSSHLHTDSDLVEVPGSTSGSSTDSDPEDDDSDSDLIPPPPAPCSCVLCTDPSPLADRRPRGKGSLDDSEFQKRGASDDGRGLSGEVQQICSFCSGGGRLGDGRAGLAAKLGRAVRLGHPHCIAVLLSKMTWSQRVAATEAPALLHPGGGPPDGGVGSSLPAVILAAQLGKPECLSLLLRRCQPDLDVTHGKKRLTALAWAAHKGYMQCCRLLIEYGANPSTKCGDGVTALHLAASGGGHIQICKLLIEHSAPVNSRSVKKQTPLCLAAQKGFVKVVQLLLENGADPNNEDEGKYTPLHLSASNGFVSCVDLLLKAGARVDAIARNGVTPLHYAVQGGHAQAVKLLISAGATVNCNRKPLLLIAADDGNLEVVQILLDAQAMIDCKANIKAQLDKDMEFCDYLTPLHLAASKGHHDVVDLLLRRGARVDEVTSKKGWAALDFAVLNGHAECALTLLKHGSSVTDNCRSVGRSNWTLVQYAAHHGAKDVVRLLIERIQEQDAASIAEPSNLVTSSTEIEASASGHIPGIVTGSRVSGDAIYGSVPPCESDELGSSSDYTEVSPGDRRPHPHGGVDDRESCQHHHHDDVQTSQFAPHRYDPRSLEGDEGGFGEGARQSNMSSTSETGNKTVTPRRRVVKEDRQSALRAREIKKREAEATEARERLEEAIAQRSAPKLTEAIAHVSKLVLHLATTVGGDVATSGGHLDHSDMNGYSSHADGHSHSNHIHTSGGGHSSHPPPPTSSAVVSAPLAMEVGLGNEVQKARKILAGLLAEERRIREEKERGLADAKRENTQQAVRKAISAALEGGDPRSLSRATNRATRTILEKDDPIVLEANALSAIISDLEKWEGKMRTAASKNNLDALSVALQSASQSVVQLKEKGGHGATIRIFGGSDPTSVLNDASKLLDELKARRESEIAKEAEAKDLEKLAQEKLTAAIQSNNNIVELEAALNQANAALLSKDSELATAIESAKKVMAKWLKAERRKLRQASNTNDPAIIEEAARVAKAFGLQALHSDIDASLALAEKLRQQAESLEILEDAISKADVIVLADIRSKLTDLGMFSEAERARAELDRLQRVTRAKSLLESAIEDSKKCQKQFLDALSGNPAESTEKIELQASWTWPDAQRLCDLSDRARKYGPSLLSLCDSADDLASDLAVIGRRILALSTESEDARGIAAVIAGYENSFVRVSKPELFDKTASDEAITEAKEHLSAVQAKDQASVKAESAQVKVEYALAASRRTAARTRTTKHSGTARSHVQQPNGGAYGSNMPSSSNGGVLETDSRSPSSLSSDFGEDDALEQEGSMAGMLNAEGTHRISRRARAISQPDELDALGDVPSSSGGCSHFYLFKEGTTVRCARCGHLRNSGNPEWLARVKRRGNKVPPESSSITLPSVGSAPDLHETYANAGSNMNGQGRSPQGNTNNFPMNDRSVHRSTRAHMPPGQHQLPGQGFPLSSINGRDGGRTLPSMGTRSNPNPASVNIMVQLMQHQNLQQRHYQSPGQQQHHTSPQPSITQPHPHSRLPHAHAQNVLSGSHGKTQGLHTPKSGHRGRGRPLVNNAAASVTVGLPMYNGGIVSGRAVGGAVGITSTVPLPTNYSSVPPIQSVPAGMAATPQGQIHGYGIGNASTLSPVNPKTGLPMSADDHVQGLGMNGSPVASRSMSLHSSRPGAGRVAVPEETGPDLGLDFANENFGFDIDAIVDDVPPPRPAKPVASHETGAQSDAVMYTPTSHPQPNGFYRR